MLFEERTDREIWSFRALEEIEVSGRESGGWASGCMQACERWIGNVPLWCHGNSACSDIAYPHTKPATAGNQARGSKFTTTNLTQQPLQWINVSSSVCVREIERADRDGEGTLCVFSILGEGAYGLTLIQDTWCISPVARRQTEGNSSDWGASVEYVWTWFSG